jgi:hypothetical protein
MSTLPNVKKIMNDLDACPYEVMDLNEVSSWVQLSSATLAKQIRRGKIKARRDGRRYMITRSEVRRVIEKNRSVLLGWNRLVDVAKELEFHRNIGESICRQMGLDKELDMNGHCRISPAAEVALRKWHKEKQKLATWTRKVDLARDLELDPRVVDNLCRKLELEFDHDLHGYVILSAEACADVKAWKVRRAQKRCKTREIDGVTWYTLRKTAEDSAAGILCPSAPGYDHLVETYYRRFLLWMRNGLAYETLDGVRYFEQSVYDRLIDDLCVMEAARMGGVGVSTVKGWITKGDLNTSDYFRCRRSISRKEYFSLLRRLYVQSPRLRKKEKVPVKILENIPETARKLQLADVRGLVQALEQETGIPAKELQALYHETGFVHRAVKNAIDKWVLLAEQGHHISVESTVVAESATQVAHMDAAEQLDNRHRKRVLQLVSTYLQKDVAEIYDLLFGANASVNHSPDIIDLLDLIEKHERAMVYRPDASYQRGDLLVHPSGGDYGLVVEAEQARTIQVAWNGDLGTITMAQRVETDYIGNDAQMLALH